MTAKVCEAALEAGVRIQASLERICKCAVGLCGSCAIGPYRVCRDGPIFDSEMLKVVLPDLGKLRLDASGKAVRVDH